VSWEAAREARKRIQGVRELLAVAPTPAALHRLRSAARPRALGQARQADEGGRRAARWPAAGVTRNTQMRRLVGVEDPRRPAAPRGARRPAEVGPELWCQRRRRSLHILTSPRKQRGRRPYCSIAKHPAVTALIDSLEQLYQTISGSSSNCLEFFFLKNLQEPGALLFQLRERSMQGWLAVITAKYYQTENA